MRRISFANDDMEFLDDGLLHNADDSDMFHYEYYPENVELHIPTTCDYKRDQSFESMKEANAHLDQVLKSNKNKLQNTNTSFEYSPHQKDDKDFLLNYFEFKPFIKNCLPMHISSSRIRYAKFI